MENVKFSKWLEQADQLSVKQRKEAKQIIFGTNKTLSDAAAPPILTDSTANSCPHCDCASLVKWGKASDLQRWRCNDCGKTFNILTNTPLARLREKDKWLVNAQAMMNGLSLKKTAEICDNQISTAFRRRHRFAEMLGKSQCNELSGITESDVTHFYQSNKGSKPIGREPRKRGGDKIPQGYGPHLVSVITLVDRFKHGAERVAENNVRNQAFDLYSNHLEQDAILLTDGDLKLGAAVKDINKAADQRNQRKHQALVGTKKSRGTKGDPIHIQTVNSQHSHLKRWMARFYGVATKYLSNYVGWHRHLSENHHQNDPNLFIGLSIKPKAVEKQLVTTG